MPFVLLDGVMGLFRSPFWPFAGVVGRFAGLFVRSSSAFRFAAGGGAGPAEIAGALGASVPRDDRMLVRYYQDIC